MITDCHIIIVENNLIVWRRGWLKIVSSRCQILEGPATETVLHHFKILRGKRFSPLLQSQEVLFF